MTAQDVVRKVESLGGAFRVERYFDADRQLLYKLGAARRNRTLAARLESVIREHREDIALLVLMREFLHSWQPGEGAWVQ
jgi:hypothetical protein